MASGGGAHHDRAALRAARATAPPGRRVLFTDLDGTLLDHDSYQPGPAAAAVARLRAADVPVVFCSAKTRAEQEPLRVRLGVTAPFVVENGAAVYLPAGFDDGDPATPEVEVFGKPYREVRAQLIRAARAVGVAVRGYGDMTDAEVAELTGLDPAAAARARTREFTESFLVEGDAPVEALRRALGAAGLRLLRGARFWTALGDHDKGTAVRYLLARLAESGPVTSYGVGDFENDLDMLAGVDVPMLVQRPDHTWADLPLPGLVRVEGIGPAGWCRAADLVLESAPPAG